MEEHYEIPVEESRLEEQQQPAAAEGHETEVPAATTGKRRVQENPLLLLQRQLG